MTTPTLHEQIAEIKRELYMRRSVYPKLIARRKLTQREADEQNRRLEAALQTLEDLKRERMAQTTLFE